MSDDDQAATRSIPLSWGSNDPTPQKPKRSLVVAPDAAEQAAFSNAQMHVICGTCVKFKLKHGQNQMQKERFLERLVIEEGWKTKHLGAPATTMGLCAETSDTITSAFSRGCEHYRRNNGRIGDL